jgi:hypothetical protein
LPTPRILYALRSDEQAIDHLRLLYRHVELLAAAGFDACVMCQGPALPALARSSAPVIAAGDRLRLRADDRVVTCEFWPDMLQLNRRLAQRRILVCQDELRMARSLAQTVSFAQLGIAEVIATGEAIAGFVRRDLKFERVSIVPPMVDLEMFRPAEKLRQIAFRPRFRAREPAFLEGAFRALHPDLADIPWVLLDEKMDAPARAQILGRSRYFLGMGLIEGVFESALEAMAAGALVAGFPGIGGRDIATSANGEWSPDGDTIKAVEALGRLVRMAERDAAGAERRRGAARTTAENHGRSAVMAALTRFWTDELARPVAPA